MGPEISIAIVFVAIILGGVSIAIAGMRHHAQMVEFIHRERLAMIEKGITPPADHMMSLVGGRGARTSSTSTKMMSLAIVLIGVGFALTTIIGFTAGVWAIAFGVGGAIAIIGAAFLVNAMLIGSRAAAAERSTTDAIGPTRPSDNSASN